MGRFLPTFCIVLASVLLGCSSHRSTIVNRYPDGTFGPNDPKVVHGVPVRLKVPTHVDVAIKETFFLGKQGNKVIEVPVMYAPGKRTRHLTVETKVAYTDKVFTVDFVRPAGGVLDMSGQNGVEFDSEQYFRSFKAKVEERTLEQIETALNSLRTGRVFAPSGATIPDEVANLFTDERIVATTRIDINDPHWEEQLHAFVGQHLTDCHPGCLYRN